MALNKEDKILIIGGHVTPALAVLDELQSRGYNNIIWAGPKHSQTGDCSLSAEFKIIEGRKLPFIPFRSGKIWRRWTIRTLGKSLRNLVLVPLGFLRAVWIILTQRPKLVISFGGYTALPLVIISRLTGRRVVTHEQTITAGMANRIISRFADLIFVSWKQTLKEIHSSNVIYTGNPIRAEVFQIATSNYRFDNKLPVIYVTGGNQGANTINRRLIKILPELLKQTNVIHQTGKSAITNDYQAAITTKKELPAELQPRYIVRDNIFGAEIGEIFARAELIVSRAGANTVTEILALGKRAVLIPIPWSSNNEQLQNARIVQKVGLGLILEQYDEMLPTELLEAIEQGLLMIKKGKAFNNEPIETSQRSAKKLVVLNAAKRVVDEIEKAYD